MFAFTIEDCERLARGKHQLLECKTAIYAGVPYDFDWTTFFLSGNGLWITGIAVIVIIAMLAPLHR